MRNALIGVCRALALSLSFGLSLPVFAHESEEHDEDFFGVSPAIQEAFREGDGGFPIFPTLGVPGTPIVVDYYYSHECDRCVESTRALFDFLSERENVEVVFHPVAVTKASYNMAAVETILYSVDPNLFQVFHFGYMAAREQGDSFDLQGFLQDLPSLTEKYDLIYQRLASPHNWDSSIDLNGETIQELRVSELPVFVVSGKHLFSDFESGSDLEKKILLHAGRAILEGQLEK